MSQHWPVFLQEGDLLLQPLRLRDRVRWRSLRSSNKEWLSEWEATLPQVPGEEKALGLPSFSQMVQWHRREGRAARAYSLAIWHLDWEKKGSALKIVGRTLIGQITLGGVMFGAMRGAHIGYWIDRSYANQGFTTQAVELLTKFAFEELGLHRVEINIRPENEPSIRVAQKAGFLFEGLRPRYLHIDGAWRDHHCYVKENLGVI